MNITKEEILSASSPWIAALLNFIPGLGTGYIYQRRWNAYWITTLSSITWVYIDLSRQQNIDLADPVNTQSNVLGILGLFIIALISSFEAVFAVIKSRKLRSKSDNFDPK